MRIVRKIQRSVRAWFEDLIYMPTWSGGRSGLGGWLSRLVTAAAQLHLPIADGGTRSRWATIENAVARPLQLLLLLVLLVASALVLISSWMGTAWGAYQPAPVDYPAPTAAADWQPVGWERMTIETGDRPRAISGAVYRYERGDIVLLAEVRFLDRATADVNAYAQRRTGLTLDGQVRGLPAGGYHQVQADDGTAWLDVCLDARGHATATPDQFDTNRRLYDRTLPRMVQWILARQPLEDRRCLWFHLSIPLDSMSEQEAFQSLESFWADWRGQWRGRLAPAPRG